MKAVFYCFIIIFTTSCGTTVYQLHTQCEKSKEEVFKSITTLLLQENLQIKHSDMELGYIQAESIPQLNIWLGAEVQRVWVITYKENKIIASAKTITITRNAFGKTTGSAETYYNDDSHEDWTWYWNVRDGLENLCGNEIIITKKKVQ